jgi:alcohol dehydrogenase, propanol-preferring
MVLGAQPQPLELADRPVPSRDRGRYLCGCACGVCRTDVHIVAGKLTKPKLPLVPGTRSSALHAGFVRRSG